MAGHRWGGHPIDTYSDGLGTNAAFFSPQGLAVDSAGNVFVADTWNELIRKVTPMGLVTTLAGKVQTCGSENGAGDAALFCMPCGVAADGTGDVFVADTYNNSIRKVTPTGPNWVVTTFQTSFFRPAGVAVDSVGNVFVADTGNHTIRNVTTYGVVTTLAGSGGNDGYADGTGNAARFSNPSSVAVDNAGNLYVADSGTGRIRKGWPATLLRTIALSGNLAFGSVTNGTTTTAILTIINRGNSALTVFDINFPNGFSGTWSNGTIEASGAANVTVTFAPSLAMLYSGLVTVYSDATEGTNTLAASGTGVAAPAAEYTFATLAGHTPAHGCA
ncbi:MAG: hypothetical protein NTW03_04220, partial [Verrucomicrobia bacterium]|nr:hypothetical protein [Verrucomicrobiota bacterium]